MYVVINGGGKVASYLARELLDHGHAVAVIEKREEVVRSLPASYPVIHSSYSVTAATPCTRRTPA